MPIVMPPKDNVLVFSIVVEDKYLKVIIGHIDDHLISLRAEKSFMLLWQSVLLISTLVYLGFMKY